MLKAVRDALKDRVKDKNIRELSLRFFALMQNSINLQETILIWKTLCVVFRSMFATTKVRKASDRMGRMVMTASLNGLEAELICDMRKLTLIFINVRHFTLLIT